MNNKENKTQYGSWKVFIRLLRKLKLPKRWIVFSILSMCAYVALNLIGVSFSSALLAGDFSAEAMSGMIICQVLTLAGMGIYSYVVYIAQYKSVLNTRKVIWERMLNVNAEYFAKHDPSYLLSAITNDAQVAVTSIVTTIITFLPQVMSIFSIVFIISAYSPLLVAVILVLIPFYILYAFVVGRWQYRVNYKIRLKIGNMTSYISERIRNLVLIKTFTTEQIEQKNGLNASEGLYDGKVQSVYLNSVFTTMIYLSDVLVNVLSVIWGAYLLKQGLIDMESWVAFFLYAITLNGQIRVIVNLWNTMKGLQGTMERISYIMDAPQEIFDKYEIEEANGDICFNDVSFAYDQKEVLHKINATIPNGKATAIVGRCGSGKTTLFRLLERFYGPNEGEITIGGVPINHVDLAKYRQQFAYVQQNDSVFSSSIREILTYGLEKEVSEQELMEVLQRVGLDHFVASLPNGLDSKLSIDGKNVSGGQRQRLVIARELLKDVNMILLDEPTSKLDYQTAKEIQCDIFKLFKGKTVAMITHDLSLIGNSDHIIVMDQGCVADEGTHEELMQRCEIYQELVNEQSYKEVYSL